MINAFKKVLTVDDEPSNNDILKEIFDSDFMLKSASSGEEAMEILNDFSPDVILLDIMMPGLDGFEVCRQMRQINSGKNAKIIFVSAKHSLSDRIIGYEVGGDDFICKPYDDIEILAKVNVFINLKYLHEVESSNRQFLEILMEENSSPLRSILNRVTALKEEDSLTDGQKASIDEIYRNCYTLWDLSEKSKAFCNLNPRSKLAAYSCELTPLITSTIQNIKYKFRYKEVSFQVTDKLVESTYLDAVNFSRGLSCLLENAVTYSPQGGNIAISCYIEGKNCIITISDEGPHFPKINEYNPFNNFFPPPAEEDERQGGINLPLAKRIIELHDGKLGVTNNTNTGVTFKISIPHTEQ
jgi:two-component system sensor histidine kinase/response regulator